MEGYKRTLNGLNQSIDASTITFEDDEFSASSFLKTNSNKEIYTVMKVGGADINTADDYTVENLSVTNEATINGTTFSDLKSDVIDNANDLSFETTSRIAQDSILSTSIGEVEADLATEISDRTSADSNLQSNITTVSNSLSTETTNRTNADNNLQTNITTVASNLATETTNRTNADNNLQTNINTVASNLATETTNRTNADNTLQSNIDSINTTITGMVDDFSNQTIAGAKTFTKTIRVNNAEGINICSAGSSTVGDRASLNLFESGNSWGHQLSNDSGDDAFRITKYQSGTNYERIKINGNGDSGVIEVYGNLSIPNNKELYYKNVTLDSRFVNAGGDNDGGFSCEWRFKYYWEFNRRWRQS